MAKVSVYRVPLSDAWTKSILDEAKRPEFKKEEERLYIRSESDSEGREVYWARYDEDGGIIESRESEYGSDGRISAMRNYFSDSDSEVSHRFSREAASDGGVVEKEEILYSGELDSIQERTFSARGILLRERTLTPEGEEEKVLRFDEAGNPLIEEDEGEDQRIERREEGRTVFEETRNSRGDLLSSRMEERDEKGRVSRSETLVDLRGVRYIGRTSYSYEGDSDKPALLRVERLEARGPDVPPRPLRSGFRMVRYDGKGRPAEILLADYEEGDLEGDSYYRLAYED
jgi:hypothetical protein